MRVFAIADLHLSTVTPKPMTIFGPQWAGHPDAIWHEWRRVVRDQDIVLLPGDLSWAMRLPDALVDLSLLSALPGKKVLLRGNHDHYMIDFLTAEQQDPAAARLAAGESPAAVAAAVPASSAAALILSSS